MPAITDLAARLPVYDARLFLPDVSLLCVETQRIPLALYALQACMRQIHFKEAVLLTDAAVATPDAIHNRVIPPIRSVAEYSDFMIRRLGDYFSGTHVLIVQWDGFVLDAKQWNTQWLAYDYIGAPWPDGRVGNGGFSLRSRRLVDALSALNPVNTHPEDFCICVEQRDVLQRDFDIQFAAREHAAQFAFETPVSSEPTFGFHAFFNFHKAMNEDALIDYFSHCDDTLLLGIPARRLLKNLYAHAMPRAAHALWQRRMQGSLKHKLDALKLRAFSALKSSSATR